MGQVLHGCATTTHAVRAAIQRSKATIAELAEKHGVNPKTVMKWRGREGVEDLPMGPKEPRSTVLSPEEEALCVAFRKHTLLPLDDCLYALQATVPHLTRSSLHRLFQRHAISRLPETDGDRPRRKKFKAYPIGYFHIDIAEVRTEEGKLYMFVAIDRTSKFAFVELHEKAKRRTGVRLKDRRGRFVRRVQRGVPRFRARLTGAYSGPLGPAARPVPARSSREFDLGQASPFNHRPYVRKRVGMRICGDAGLASPAFQPALQAKQFADGESLFGEMIGRKRLIAPALPMHSPFFRKRIIEFLIVGNGGFDGTRVIFEGEGVRSEATLSFVVVLDEKTASLPPFDPAAASSQDSKAMAVIALPHPHHHWDATAKDILSGNVIPFYHSSVVAFAVK